MFNVGFDNNGVLAPAVDGFTKIIDNLTLNNTKVVTNQKVKPDNFNPNINLDKVNLSKIVEPLLQPVNDFLNFNQPKNKPHNKTKNNIKVKDQWVFFDRIEILPKPFNNFLNGLNLPRFYYLILRDWTIIQALQIPVAVLIGGITGFIPAIPIDLALFSFGLSTPFWLPGLLASLAGLGLGLGSMPAIYVLNDLAYGSLTTESLSINMLFLNLMLLFLIFSPAILVFPFLRMFIDFIAIIGTIGAWIPGASINTSFVAPILTFIFGFVAFVVSSVFLVPLTFLFTWFITILAMAVMSILFPIIVTILSGVLFAFLTLRFILSLKKPHLLTKHALDKARRASKHHGKKTSRSKLGNKNNRDKTNHGKRKVSTVKQVELNNYNTITGFEHNLINHNQQKQNISKPVVGVLTIPLNLLNTNKTFLNLPNNMVTGLMKQDTATPDDGTVCQPSGPVGITCHTITPTDNSNINSAVQEQTQTATTQPATITTTTTNSDGTTTTTTKPNPNKTRKAKPKKVYPLPTTGLLKRIDYYVLQNRATGRHNNLVNLMDNLYGTSKQPGPLRPIAEATAGLVDNI